MELGRCLTSGANLRRSKSIGWASKAWERQGLPLGTGRALANAGFLKVDDLNSADASELAAIPRVGPQEPRHSERFAVPLAMREARMRVKELYLQLAEACERTAGITDLPDRGPGCWRLLLCGADWPTPSGRLPEAGSTFPSGQARRRPTRFGGRQSFSGDYSLVARRIRASQRPADTPGVNAGVHRPPWVLLLGGTPGDSALLQEKRHLA